MGELMNGDMAWYLDIAWNEVTRNRRQQRLNK